MELRSHELGRSVLSLAAAYAGALTNILNQWNDIWNSREILHPHMGVNVISALTGWDNEGLDFILTTINCE